MNSAAPSRKCSPMKSTTIIGKTERIGTDSKMSNTGSNIASTVRLVVVSNASGTAHTSARRYAIVMRVSVASAAPNIVNADVSTTRAPGYGGMYIPTIAMSARRMIGTKTNTYNRCEIVLGYAIARPGCAWCACLIMHIVPCKSRLLLDQ